MRNFTVKWLMIFIFCFTSVACGGGTGDKKQKNTSTSENNISQTTAPKAKSKQVSGGGPDKHVKVQPKKPNKHTKSGIDRKKQQELSEKLAKELLHSLRSNTKLSADFDEIVVNHTKDGNREQLHRGHMDLKRPDKFIWKTFIGKKGVNIDEELIGNGGVYWQYDPQLQQAIKRKVNLDKQPLIKLLLSDEGSSMDLSRNFNVTKKNVSAASGEVVFVLTSKDDGSESNLARMIIVLKNNVLSQLSLENNLNQETVFQFSNLDQSVIKDSLFEFKPGDDVDVVDNT
jgi:chaperone LolA